MYSLQVVFLKKMRLSCEKIVCFFLDKCKIRIFVMGQIKTGIDKQEDFHLKSSCHIAHKHTHSYIHFPLMFVDALKRLWMTLITDVLPFKIRAFQYTHTKVAFFKI